MTIVLCAKGYGNYIKNSQISNIQKLKLSKNDYIYHAGTKILDNEIISSGGRVLNVTVIGNNFLIIRKKIIFIIKQLNWKNGFFRKDIGWKIINKK